MEDKGSTVRREMWHVGEEAPLQGARLFCGLLPGASSAGYRMALFGVQERTVAPEREREREREQVAHQPYQRLRFFSRNVADSKQIPLVFRKPNTVTMRQPLSRRSLRHIVETQNEECGAGLQGLFCENINFSNSPMPASGIDRCRGGRHQPGNRSGPVNSGMGNAGLREQASNTCASVAH